VPLYFGIQLPECVLFLLVVFVFFLPKIWRHSTLPQKQGLSLLLLTAFIPIFYAMLLHPVLYDAVRHFLFVVPLMCVMAALAARACFKWCVAQFQRPLATQTVASSLYAIAALFLL
jgi:hypothetical protein